MSNSDPGPRVALVAVIATLASSCCPPFCPPPPGSWQESKYDTALPLGFRSNNIRLIEEVYAGNSVARFRIKLRVPADDHWIPGLKINVYRGFFGAGGLVQSFNAVPADHVDGTFWTVEIPGNAARVEVTSTGGFIPLTRVAGGWLNVEAVSKQKDANVPYDYFPDPAQPLADLVAQGRVVPLHRSGGEFNGFFGGLVETHYYYVDVYEDERVALYVSPLCLSLRNAPGISMYVDDAGFVKPTTEYSPFKRTPHKGDKGIYEEFGPYSAQKRLYVSLQAVVGCAYSITATTVLKRFDVVVEMSDGMVDRTARSLDPSFYEGVINWTNPDGHAHRDFVHLGSTVKYLRRAREVLVLATADMLAASEGQLRFKRADIYQSEHLFLNADVFIHQIDGRAYASPTKINIFKNDLDEPVDGGATLHHEWGHFEYGMDDEYEDLPNGTSNPLDPNSVMGNSGSYNNVPAFEFCSDLNHTAGGDSNHSVLYDQYWGYVAGPYPDGQSRYHDVLHALEDQLTFNYYE